MIALGPSPRILITRLSAIGDCIHTLPLVDALRARFPRAFIAWATQGGGASLIQGTPGLDETIVVDRNWLKRLSSIRAMRNQLGSYNFDVTIDPQSLTKSSMLGWLTGARHRIGFAKGQGRELSPWLSTHRVAPQTSHVVDRYLELLGPMGIHDVSPRFNFPTNRIASSSMQRFLHTQSLPRFVLLNPGAGWNSKLWPHDRYAVVAKYLRNSRRVGVVVLWAGDHERSLASEIVVQSDGAATLAPSTTLPELTELCRSAELFVGSDTGPMHLAAAVGTRCVSMYGPTKPSICGPYGLGHEALQEYYQDGTSSERRGDDNSAMRAISAESVCAACDRILNAVGTRVA